MVYYSLSVLVAVVTANSPDRRRYVWRPYLQLDLEDEQGNSLEIATRSSDVIAKSLGIKMKAPRI